MDSRWIGNNMFKPSKEFVKSMNDWLTKDPDPLKTINSLKKKQERLAEISKKNPRKLMKMLMRPDEIMAFEVELKQKKKLAKENPEATRELFSLPQCVVNANPNHWRKVIDKKLFNQYPYFCIKPYVKRKTKNSNNANV